MSVISSVWGALKSLAVAGLYAAVVVYVLADQWFYRFDTYFYTGKVVVPLVVDHGGFKMDVSAHPNRHFDGSYKVLLRNSATGQVVKEYPESGVFEYKPKYDENGEQLPSYPDAVGFDWWVGLKGRLPVLPTGLFYVQTCWTVHDRPSLLGDVTGCVESNQFRVVEAE